MIFLVKPGEDELVLSLELAPGALADATVAADALLAWIAAIRETNRAIDPASDVTVELLSADLGSLKFRTILRFIESKLVGPPADALADFPRLKKLVVATVIGLPAGLAVSATGALLLPDATVNLSPGSKRQYERVVRSVQQVPAVQQRVRTFYSVVERDRKIEGVSVSEKPGAKALVAVPRAEFAERSGTWQIQEQGKHERQRKDVWQVVVTRAALKAEPRAWSFERDGLPFSAQMADAAFLRAIKAGTLPITLQEGVEMVVEVEWTERLEGQVWEPTAKTRKISRVLSPAPRRVVEGNGPLFGPN